jgi:pimeloyl-ACP methyl ester carboxylesterase
MRVVHSSSARPRPFSAKARLLACGVAAALALASAGATHAHAVSTAATVVDLPTRGVTQRFLYLRPVAPVANIIFLPGTDGILGIEDDGSMPTVAGRCAPFARSRDAFASRGFALALVDQTSDLEVRQFTDIREVARYMQHRDNVPTWIVGGSGSTMGALDFAVEYPIGDPLGLIIFSPWQPDAARAAQVKRPTLVVYHREDPLSKPYVDPLFDALTAAPVKERVGLTGGRTDECSGHHLYAGIDDELVQAIASFIDRHNTFGPPSASKPQ